MNGCAACVILDGGGRVWWEPRALPEPRSNILHYAAPDALAGVRGVVRDNLARVS
jgi:hypothetical protein